MKEKMISKKWRNTDNVFKRSVIMRNICSFQKITIPKKHRNVVFATFLLACFLNLKESTCETKINIFYFTSKAFRSLENQILEFYIFKIHDVIKYLSIKQERDFNV